MAASGGGEVEDDGQPYCWDEGPAPSAEVLQLWVEVGNGLDKNQTVVWKSAVESLDSVLQFLTSSPQARDFCEQYMCTIISILVEQVPAKIGVHERNCVQESLHLAVRIVAKDLKIQLERQSTCKVLQVLSLAFNKKKAFYKGGKTTSPWNVTHHHPVAGMPEVRLKVLERFRSENGFQLLHQYLMQQLQQQKPNSFPTLPWLHDILIALADTISTTNRAAAAAITTTTTTTNPPQPQVAAAGSTTTIAGVATTENLSVMGEDAVLVSKAVMQYIRNWTEEDFKKNPPEELKIIQTDLQRIFDRIVATRRGNTYEFYEFWRGLALDLIGSQSLPLKLFGWEQVADLIRACESHRPPPRAFIVTNAGTPFANGIYEFAGEVTPDGYARSGTEFSYVHQVPDDAKDGPGKKLTLFRCTMRSQQKWWFLSEADEEQPGTDRDIDYYQHKTKDYEEAFPPNDGWITCRNAGQDPPPKLAPQGLLVPPGAEFETLEHQLAKWAIENEIVEQVLGDTTIHREVVSRSTVLIKFLANMCNRVTEQNNMYCLQASHLLFAWKTCTRKADAAVSLQVYQLLVSILPLCPSSLAIPLLQAVQKSLHESDEKRDYLYEVSEFCSALADGNLVDGKNTSRVALSEDVREEALNLLWSVLTHPDASSLKSYDSLKQYVTHELKVEPKGSEHRERFLNSCIAAMKRNETIRTSPVDEVQALRMVKLLDFVLVACPQEQANKLVSGDNSALSQLVFHELTAYLDRRQSSGAASNTEDSLHRNSLQERLRIFRHVLGLSSDPLGVPALKDLWKRCVYPSDREAVMVFISNASQTENKTRKAEIVGPQQLQENVLPAALSNEVRYTVFLELFCSPAFKYDELGENGYWSFQFLFSQMNQPTIPPTSKKIALDALWRVCLTVGKDAVAQQAMKDLLSVYVSRHNPTLASNGMENSVEQMVVDDMEENFEVRIYEHLAKVKSELGSGSPSARLSVQRCLRILKAAIGQSEFDPLSTTSSLMRLNQIRQDASFDDVIRCLPHGMRGQASYRRIGIIVKGGTQKPSSTTKFSLDVHPLETLASLKSKVASSCKCSISSIKPVQINGRAAGTGLRSANGDHAPVNLNSVRDDAVMDQLGVVQGCEVVFVAMDRIQNSAALAPVHTPYANDLSSFFFSKDGKFADRLFTVLLGVLEALPHESGNAESAGQQGLATHKLVWDLLLAMPTDVVVAKQVRSVQELVSPPSTGGGDAMEIDQSNDIWSQLLSVRNFDRSVYVLLTIDAFLEPAPEALSILPEKQRLSHEKKMLDDANAFRRLFIDAGGFTAVVRFFSASGSDEKVKQTRTRRGNAVALRILKSCLFGNDKDPSHVDQAAKITADKAGMRLLESLSDVGGLLRSLIAMVVDDGGISSSTISDVLRFLWLFFHSPRAAQSFVSLAGAERFLVALLLWDGGLDAARTSSSISASMHVRKTAHDLILHFPLLADHALRWLMSAIDGIDTSLESTSEFFDVLERLVDSSDSSARSSKTTEKELKDLGVIVCKKLASCPRPISETDLLDYNTGVLCGCLRLLRALIERGGSTILKEASVVLLSDLKVRNRWSMRVASASHRGVLSLVSSPFSSRAKTDDAVLVDIMGVIFDMFLSPQASSGVAMCCDKESRRRGFDVVGAAARSCASSEGYIALVGRLKELIESTAPRLRHRWGQFGNASDHRTRERSSAKYSGLRNQGCTCYMNSVLQQLFMMPELRDSMCSAPLPTRLRSSGSASSDAGAELVGKKISLQWDNGVSYDAFVESFDKSTGAHTIRYIPVQVATVDGTRHQVRPEDIAQLSPNLPDEFILSEGRPGKETGVFEVVTEPVDPDSNGMATEPTDSEAIQESEDESWSRHLLEEVQRTFIHLKEGSKGRCFDPRALVEASACLKLEFDVWQQNDASEFSTKLLDRLEISLKKWAPKHFRYMDHTFGLKQTKQKICKECGLKTNREEKLLNINCQIRGMSDIHEALDAVTEVEIMEGSNQVVCDNCKKKTDTILRTAISTLPNMLILSLKRFDLDYTTFETVKLNNRCAFPETLNMKKYTLEGQDAYEETTNSDDAHSPIAMETDDGKVLTDEDYQYRLVGVLVHAGVAQGGHYYSFIKDRNPGSEGKWYRFDDEDVTPFDPSLIESECFGGKIKKETKFPNGQIHTVEQEQFANALMLFYEKVKPTAVSESEDDEDEPVTRMSSIATSTGYEAFEPDVLSANTTHRWQTFLFDNEFQAFLKGLLGVCRLALEPNNTNILEVGNSWVPPMMEMLLSFMFDIMLYGSEFSSLDEWTCMMDDHLSIDRDSGYNLVKRLALTSQTVCSNWLRTFLLECPDRAIRSAAVRVFSAAVKSCLLVDDELRLLGKWSQAWRDQVSSMLQSSITKEPMPCTLVDQEKSLEDIRQIGGGASTLGIIISFINVLMDVLPRSWRFSAEIFEFIRNIACASLENGKRPFRRPMVEATVAARIVALILRDKGSATLRAAFPSASVSLDAANTQVRAESNPNSHVVPMATNTVLTSDITNQRGPSSTDYLVMFEALTSLGGLPCTFHAPLTSNSDEHFRSRQRHLLSEKATFALRLIFEECCSPGAPGMTGRDLESYLRRCGVDRASMTPQKIHDMLTKFPAPEENGSTGEPCMSLEGFLSYYRDCVQSNDIRLRMDLHTFGFRPDLSRRSKNARFVTIGDRESFRAPTESVAIDVAEMLGSTSFDAGTLANTALSSIVHVHNAAYNASEPMMEYLVAASVYGKDGEPLINRILQVIYNTPNDWAGNERVTGAVLMLQTIASIPGEHQQRNIQNIMLSTMKPNRSVNFGGGLLEATRALHGMSHPSSSHHYNNEIYLRFARYVSILRDLHGMYPLFEWMNVNRPSWAFIERELLDTRGYQQEAHSPYVGSDAEQTIPSHDNVQSDSDMAGGNDSEDDDSRFDIIDSPLMPAQNDGPYEIIVQGAGNPAVNGVYHQDGFFSHACRYAMIGRWNNADHRFFIFQCSVSNNTQHWYISIVPFGGVPGTSSDIDFYSAPVTEDCRNVPPSSGWIKANEGTDPVPTIVYNDSVEDTSQAYV